MASVLPLNIFPGFTSHGVVSDAVREIATVFNAEGLQALQEIPESAVRWADVGTRTTRANIDAKIPVQLTALLGFEPFNGERHYHPVTVASVAVKPMPWSVGMEWPIQIGQSGIPELVNFYGVSGLASQIVSHARAAKADMVASLIIAGMTNVNLGMTATALTIPQPGATSGLPLFHTAHYANPLSSTSATFSNLSLGAGTFASAFGQTILDMSQVPHPSKANMTMGLGVTDIIGPTRMLETFYRTAIQTLSLQTTTSPGNIGVASSNIWNPDLIRQAGPEKLIGTAGLTPWRFWIAPQLDSHPYMVANPTKDMWFAVSARPGAAWAELAGPSPEFAPRITLLGDGSEEAMKTRKVRIFGDLDAGIAAGLPHFVHAYFETTP